MPLNDLQQLKNESKRISVDKRTVRENRRDRFPWQIATLDIFSKDVRYVLAQPHGSGFLVKTVTGSLSMIDAVNRLVRYELNVNPTHVNLPAFSSDGRRFVYVTDDSEVRVINSEGGSLAASIKLAESGLSKASLNHDGTLVFAMVHSKEFPNGSVAIWDVQTRQMIQRLNETEFFTLEAAMNLQGSRILTNALNPFSKLFDTQSGKEIKKFAHSSGQSEFRFSSNGKYLITEMEDHRLKFFSAKTGDLTHELTGHSDRVNTIDFDDVDKHALSVSNDQTVILWISHLAKLFTALKSRV